MKYTDFLNETKNYENTTKLEIEEFKKIYASLDNKEPFYRGMKRAPSEIMLVDGSKRERKSIDDIGNYYTIMIDKVNSEYPKRSNGVMFSGSEKSASVFGKMHLVFPLNGVKVATVNQSDLWKCKLKFKHMKPEIDLYNFAETLTELRIKDDSYENMIESITKLLDNYLNKYATKLTDTYKETTIKGLRYGDFDKMNSIEALALSFNYDTKNIKPYLDDIFTASNLNLALYKSAKDATTNMSDYEYWCDGEVLIIDSELFDSIKKDL